MSTPATLGPFDGSSRSRLRPSVERGASLQLEAKRGVAADVTAELSGAPT